MKPQSLQDAIKAAAAKKRSKVEQGGWKEPEVKTHRLTADEYQAAKSGGRCGGGRPQVPSAAVGSGVATTTSNGSTGSGISAQASSDLLRKIESERREFLKEKQEILSEMRAYRREMTETKQPHCASLRQSVDLLSSKVEKLEIENKTLREKVRSGSSNEQQSSRISTTDLDVERLEARVEKLESENRKLRERIISGGGGDDIERLQSKVERLEDESRRLREKTTAIDQLEEETRRLRDKLSAISSFPTSPLTSRAEASVPVTPKSPAVSKSSYTPISPSTPAKAPVATNALAYKSPSPTKTPKKTKSASSIASPGLDARSGGSALCRLFSADKLSKQQARDDALKAYLSHPDAPIGMYPRKTMSVVNVEGKSLVHFRGKVYVPQNLRERTMRHYLELYPSTGRDDAKAKLAEDCTWPHQERDMFDFVRSQS